MDENCHFKLNRFALKFEKSNVLTEDKLNYISEQRKQSLNMQFKKVEKQ